MKKYFASALMIVLCSIVITKEINHENPKNTSDEGCLTCHKQVTDPDSSHPVRAFGCFKCHLGNPYSYEEKRAHRGIVRNPSDLRVVDKTCGQPGCHSDIVPRVKSSIMATNLGILKTLQSRWHNIKDAKTELKDLLGDQPPRNLAIDHFRKMCGGCHLWKERGDRPGEVGRRGGGCSDCHIIDEESAQKKHEKSFIHPKLTTKIPSENCVKCHNRSARIGLSYFGKFESAGYGTPYEGTKLNSRRLSGNRFYIHLPPDIHFEKAGMECIDCHTGKGLMGDGNRYDNMKDQVDITCEACHAPTFSEITSSESLAGKLAFLNKKVPTLKDKSVIGITNKQSPLYNLQVKKGKLLFYRKKDGFPIEIKTRTLEKPYHNFKGHERLTCQACHSKWMPQCYGCHLSYRESEYQRDWLTGKRSSGRWIENRSYQRFATPSLAVAEEEKILPASLCRVFVSCFDKNNGYKKNESFTSFSITAFDPHTTSHQSRACRDCHGNPKVLGFGEGILFQKDGENNFRSTFDSVSSQLGINFPLDGLVGVNGNSFTTPRNREPRPFNQPEIKKILSVQICIGCHNEYEDPIYLNFQNSLKRFRTEANLPCLR